jgi:hypothetical protein
MRQRQRVTEGQRDRDKETDENICYCFHYELLIHQDIIIIKMMI